MPEKAKAGKFRGYPHLHRLQFGLSDLLFKDKDIKCVLNPSLGREYETKKERASKPEKRSQ
jgi:hypothetical protein